MKKLFILFFISLVFNSLSVASETKLLRYPDIFKSKIAFCYGGDIYTSTITGENVNQLTNYPGEEKLPKFSPDGKHIAFTANREGNVDVYVIPVSGGKATRLTYDPTEEEVVDWHPDGKRIVFRSASKSFSYRFNRLHAVSVKGGLPQCLALPEAELSDFNDRGDRVAFCRTSVKMLNFKGYRGGMAPDIWIYNFKEKKSKLIVKDNSVNHHPLWIGGMIYFTSDRSADGVQNLWAYQTSGGSVKQVTHSKEWGIKWPSKGKNQIIYEKGGALYRYSLKDNTNTQIKVKINLPQSSFVRNIKGAKKDLFASDSALSPDGKRFVCGVRGDLFLYETGNGNWANLTNTSGHHERGSTWSPDGKSIAFISDESGEEQIYLKDIEKNSRQRVISNCSKQRLRNLRWSPDGKKIGYSDQRSSYFYIELESMKTQKVIFDVYAGSEYYIDASWSPDSNWLVFDRYAENSLRFIQLYSLKKNKIYTVTDGRTDDFKPVFDPQGNYLYWVSNRKVNVEFVSVRNNETFFQSNPSIILAANLRSDMISPLADQRKREKGRANRQTGDLRIDLEGLGNRITALPIGNSNYDDLISVAGKLIYSSVPYNGDASIKLFDFKDKKEYELMENVNYCRVSATGNKILYIKRRYLSLLDLKPDQKLDVGCLDLSSINLSVDLKQEWKQIFNEAWRIQRELCFDEKLNGVDWLAVKTKYEQLLPHVGSRRTLNYLIEEMFAELGYGHIEIMGGDFPVEQDNNDGVLGIDLQWDEQKKAYRISHIYPGQNWVPGRESPLTLPGMNVSCGDYLIAIDGKKLTKRVNPYSFLVNKANKNVMVTISKLSNKKETRTIQVKAHKVTQNGEDFLRYHQWVQNNTRLVSKAGAGRIGYIHLADTYLLGFESFIDGFYSQINKEALIIDVRYNSGGYNPSMMIDRMNQIQEFRWKVPNGKVYINDPGRASYSPKVCLINEWSESGGDMFAYLFRKHKTGQLIGKRTTGIMAGANAAYLMDKGYVVFPVKGNVDKQGNLLVENVGVSPDIEITNRPEDLMNGKDAQLARAIEEIMKKIDLKK